MAKTLWEDATTNLESAFMMRCVKRRGTAGVECGGGCSTIVWGKDWNNKKRERGNGVMALGGLNFMGRCNNQPRVGVRNEGC